MKKHLKKSFSLAKALLLSCCAFTGQAQNAIFNSDGGTNVSLDYIDNKNEYLLLGETRTLTSIAGMSNACPFGFLPRMRLQVVSDGLSTNLLKTYCTQDEVNYVMQGRCAHLSVAFYPYDAKKTSDGGYIVCGKAFRNSETSNCRPNSDNPNAGLPAYSNVFLLKTDANGNPQWYKRYDYGSWLTSVVEDPATGNFIACGQETASGFILGVDKNGKPLWAYKIRTPFTNDPANENPSSYSEITPYAWKGKTYYALTGNSGRYYMIGGYINLGGILLTLVDANGSMPTNVFISGDNNGQYFQGIGINTAYDGDVVITGATDGTVCGVKNGNNTVLLKINPTTLSMNFIKTYENSDASVGNSVVMNKTGGNIFVTGSEGHTDILGFHEQGMYMETDNSGNLLRNVPYAADHSIYGKAIVYNTNNGYPVYSGGSAGLGSGVGTSLIRNNYGFDCDPDNELNVKGLKYEIFNSSRQSVLVKEIPEQMAAYNLQRQEVIKCGNLRPAPLATAAVSQAGKLTLSPNPAEDKLRIELPDGLREGVQLKVYDLTGKVVLSHDGKNGAASVQLDVSGLVPGAYLIVANNGAHRVHDRFVKH